MEQSEFQSKMSRIKSFVKIGFIVSLILTVLCLLLLITFNFAGVFTIQTLPGTKYENAFTYPGWQAIYWGVGEMIIQGYTEFTFNIFNFLGFLLPFLGIIVWLVMYLKSYKVRGTNKKKAILEFVAAGLILFGGFMLFFCDKFAIMNAKNVKDSYQNYYTEYLLPAINGEVSFQKTFFPVLLLIISILTALVKVANGCLLIFQKKFALKNKGAK
ncbi:MAG: hypothetical protein SPI51_03995 [Candidatus Enterosoma sp.]|nr:hypothetical protein [Bacilli bacterium]MDD7082140.1 hypothetical protein [bacterium]MDY3081137.1 hypothetical protein [Candidatus Enterosoma sp.]MDY5256898.1 hypothetical protein [Candidatus Enterosoma sp.]MDY6064145.1 hypothetical protein [Candidatus Enterosoma sp.]